MKRIWLRLLKAFVIVAVLVVIAIAAYLLDDELWIEYCIGHRKFISK